VNIRRKCREFKGKNVVNEKKYYNEQNIGELKKEIKGKI